MRLWSVCALGALLFLVSACSGPRGPERGPPGGRMGPDMMRPPLLFISPMGEAFRVAGAGESPLDLWFLSVDASRDGALSREEFLTAAQAFFVRLDANQDGSATSSESTTLWQREAPEMLANVSFPPSGPPRGRRGGPGGGPPGGGGGGPPGGGGGGPPGGGGGGPPGGGGGGPPGGGGGGPPGGEGGGRPRGGPDRDMAPRFQGAQQFGLLGDVEPVMSCDKDLSRRVTQVEFETCADARFSELDPDADGLFLRTEARLWRERAGPMGRPPR